MKPETPENCVSGRNEFIKVSYEILDN